MAPSMQSSHFAGARSACNLSQTREAARDWRRTARASLTLILAAAGATVVLARQDHPTAPHVHADAQKLQNPIANTPASVEAGAKSYARFCVNCHGVSGRGNGRLAAGMSMYGKRPSDLTDDQWQHGSSDGEIFVVIRDGIGPDFHMDGYQGRLSDEEIWNVVNFVKSLTIKRD